MEDYKRGDWLREKYWEDGMSINEMADLQGVSSRTIYNHMEKNGIERRSEGWGFRYARLYTNDGYQRWVVEGGDATVSVHQLLAISEGADPHEVFSEDVHVHHDNGVRWDNRPENISVMDESEHIALHMKENHEKTALSRRGDWWDEDLLREMYHEEGMTAEEIADEFDTVVPTIIDCMEKLGIERRSRGNTSPKPWHDKQVLIDEYLRTDRTQKEAAEELGCSAPTLRKWLSKHDLSAR